MPWQPLVEDAAARARVTQVIGEIVAALEAGERDAFDDADLALVRVYAATDDAVPDPAGAAGAALARAVGGLRGVGRLGLYGGAARIGWTLAHLGAGDAAAQACATIDAHVAPQLAAWAGDYDLISGLVGFGVYALERGDAGRELAAGVLDALERRAQPRNGGIAWHTGPELLIAEQRAGAPDGYWNLGVAHGMPGVVGLLARMVAAGVAPERARPLLDGAVRYLLAVSSPATRERGRFTSWLPDDGAPSLRLAWCYNDLGVAVALAGAGLHAREDGWLAEAVSLARSCAARSWDAAAVKDANLCHGAAGVAHLFHRLARATGDGELAAAARSYLDRTLAMRRAEPVAGFPRVYRDRDGEHADPDRSLLSGAAGVALALHAATSAVEPGWDRLLLADLPIREP